METRKQRSRKLTGFLKDDVNKLIEKINNSEILSADEELLQFASYWGYHLKDIETSA